MVNNKSLISVVTFAVFVIGCSTILPGNDPVVVRAEQSVKSSIAVIDSFLKYEYDNRITLLQIDSNIKKTADKIRAESPKYIREARILIKVYKTNRTVENKANLNTALKVLDEVIVIINGLNLNK